MIFIYIVIASLSGSDIKVNQSIPFTNMMECKAYVSKNQTNMIDSANRAYGKVDITEMGCVSMNSLVLQPVFYFEPM